MSVAAEQTNKDNIFTLQKLCQDMLLKSTDYFQEEIKRKSEDYKLLEKLNNQTQNYYAEMREISSKVNLSIDELNRKSNELKAYFQMVDQLDASLNNLEQAAYQIDSYSKRLETKFKQLEKN